MVLEFARYYDEKCLSSVTLVGMLDEGKSVCAQPGGNAAAVKGSVLPAVLPWTDLHSRSKLTLICTFLHRQLIKHSRNSFLHRYSMKYTLWNKVCMSFQVNILHLLDLLVVFSSFNSICMMGLCSGFVLFLITLLCVSFFSLSTASSCTLLDNSLLILYAFVLAPTWICFAKFSADITLFISRKLLSSYCFPTSV